MTNGLYYGVELHMQADVGCELLSWSGFWASEG